MGIKEEEVLSLWSEANVLKRVAQSAMRGSYANQCEVVTEYGRGFSLTPTMDGFVAQQGGCKITQAIDCEWLISLNHELTDYYDFY